MTSMQGDTLQKLSEKDLAARHRAFEILERIRRPIEGLDEKKELEEWREEKACK